MSAPTNAEEDAVIIGADIAAAHDGEAELVLRVRYQNGIVGKVVLHADVAFSLLRNCGVDSIDDLAGQSWRKNSRKRR